MSVSELANIVTTTDAWLSGLIIFVGVASAIAIGYLVYQLREQRKVINDMKRELRYIQRHLK